MILKVAAWDTKLTLKFFKIKDPVSFRLHIKWTSNSLTHKILHNLDSCHISSLDFHHPVTCAPPPSLSDVKLSKIIHTMNFPPLFLGFPFTFAWWNFINLLFTYYPKLKYLSVKISPNYSITPLFVPTSCRLSYICILVVYSRTVFRVILHCRCNPKKYSQEAQRMNWLGCKIWQMIKFSSSG